MAQSGSRTIVLKTSAAQTVSAAGSEIVLPDGYKRMYVFLDVTAASGTTPTLNVYLQRGIRQIAAADAVNGVTTGTIKYNDLISFTQVTGVTARFAAAVESTNFEAAAQDAALAAGTVRAGPLAGRWRPKWTIGGTSPSFTFSIILELLP